GDSAARSAYYNTMRTLGIYSADDILSLEDMNPIGEEGGGQKRLVQINQTTLDKVGEIDQEPVVPAQVDADSPNATGDNPQNADDPVNAWFMAAARRIASREQQRATDAAKRCSTAADFETW